LGVKLNNKKQNTTVNLIQIQPSASVT